MPSPDPAACATDRLARIEQLETQRAAALAAGADAAQQQAIARIVAQQHAEALAFACRRAP